MTYLYECPACGEFELTHPLSVTRKRCPTCRKGLKRLIASAPPTKLLGAGWAKDGYDCVSHPRFTNIREGRGVE